MAIMATESATSSKKPGSPESHESTAPTVAGDERDTKRARPGEVGKSSGDKAPQTGHGRGKPSSPRAPDAPDTKPEDLDDELEDPYDNVACTD
jgi:hypothetical protein